MLCVLSRCSDFSSLIDDCQMTVKCSLCHYWIMKPSKNCFNTPPRCPPACQPAHQLVSLSAWICDSLCRQSLDSLFRDFLPDNTICLFCVTLQEVQKLLMYAQHYKEPIRIVCLDQMNSFKFSCQIINRLSFIMQSKNYLIYLPHTAVMDSNLFGSPRLLPAAEIVWSWVLLKYMPRLSRKCKIL